MVMAIEFAVRNSAGGTQHGNVVGEGQGNFIQVASGDAVSLNLARASVVGYEQHGGDLIVKLVDGRSIVLSNYFNEAPGAVNHLYLSSDGEITEVLVQEGHDGVLFANYGPVSGWDKWSPLDDMRFTQADSVSDAALVSNEPAGMAPFVPGLMGGFGGLGALAAGAGAVAAIGGGGGGGGGTDTTGHIPPTVDPQDPALITTNTENPHMPVSGTGNPGDHVVVTIGDKTLETEIGTDGKWHVDFPGDDLPADGDYTTTVVVTDPATDKDVTLTGPDFTLDLTPPDVNVEHGTKSVHDVENRAEYQDGVTLSGNGEAGATVKVEINGHSHTVTVDEDGNWTMTFSKTEIAPGEYEIPVKITATDIHGNTTVKTDMLVVDTVPHPITFDAVTGDDKVNFTETQSGLVVTGTSTAGATLEVTLHGVKQTVVVGANGKWSVTYPTGTLPAGEYTDHLVATTTDAAGNVSSVTHSFQVDTHTSVAFTNQAGGDGKVNGAEASAGVVLTGTAQPGATVNVAWNGTTLPATVAANGTWTVTFPASSIPAGTYSSTAVATATDSFGNTATTSQKVRVDTETSVAINNGQSGGDDMISGAEAKVGVALTGTAEPGARVVVTMEGVSHTVTAGANGQWTSTFAASEIRGGTYASNVTVTATDAFGNTASSSHVVNVDTEVKPFDRATLSTGSDSVLNGVEATSGLTVTGNVEPGSTVMVKFGDGSFHAATVSANGVWSLTIPAGEVPAGEHSVTLTAVATDRVGNSSTISESVTVDTLVTNFHSTNGVIGGDGVLNAAERAAGLTLTGTSEVGSTIVLHLANGQEVRTVVGSNGTWSAHFDASQLPTGETSTSVLVTATDRAGNTASYSENFAVDTVAPADPRVTADAGYNNLIFGIATEAAAGDMHYYAVGSNGVAAELSHGAINTTNVDVNGHAVSSEWAMFNNTVPDGSYLVIADTDAAGNQSSTLYLRSTTGETTVDLSRAGLAQFDFGTIDLSASHSTLTLTEAQINRLTGADHQMTIRGAADDHVNLVGAVNTGHTEVINGDTYKLYTLGTSGASVLVDDDIVTTLTAGV